MSDEKQTRTLSLAGVQIETRNREVEANLAHAGQFVALARERGAQLVLCPELLAPGYVYDASLWKAAEPQGGPTERWLRRMAIEHRVHIGASYLEASGDHFLNTFTLVQPDGAVAGRVRKESLPGFEGWYFRGCPGPKVIDIQALFAVSDTLGLRQITRLYGQSAGYPLARHFLRRNVPRLGRVRMHVLRVRT